MHSSSLRSMSIMPVWFRSSTAPSYSCKESQGGQRGVRGMGFQTERGESGRGGGAKGGGDPQEVGATVRGGLGAGSRVL